MGHSYNRQNDRPQSVRPLLRQSLIKHFNAANAGGPYQLLPGRVVKAQLLGEDEKCQAKSAAGVTDGADGANRADGADGADTRSACDDSDSAESGDIGPMVVDSDTLTGSTVSGLSDCSWVERAVMTDDYEALCDPGSKLSIDRAILEEIGNHQHCFHGRPGIEDLVTAVETLIAPVLPGEEDKTDKARNRYLLRILIFFLYRRFVWCHTCLHDYPENEEPVTYRAIAGVVGLPKPTRCWEVLDLVGLRKKWTQRRRKGGSTAPSANSWETVQVACEIERGFTRIEEVFYTGCAWINKAVGENPAFGPRAGGCEAAKKALKASYQIHLETERILLNRDRLALGNRPVEVFPLGENWVFDARAKVIRAEWWPGWGPSAPLASEAEKYCEYS